MKKIQLTNAHKEKLFQIPLFRDLPLNIKESLLDKLDFVIYAADKKEIVVTQGTPCNKLYVLLEGKLRTDIIDGLGNEVMIEYIIAPRTFATPHLFNSNNTLPATFTALEDSVVLMATKDSTFKVISQDPQVLHNFLCIAGNCNICTVSRLKPLSRKTVRERFIVYLFEHKKKDSLTVEIMHTQSQLAEYLNEAGFKVTQATVSRDIRDLKLTKVPAENGRQKYAVLQSAQNGMTEKYVRILRDGFSSMDMAQNILVLKTVSGMAMAVAAALDAMNWNEIVGCIAGDDTIMCAVRSVDDTILVMDKIKKLVAE